MINHKLVTQTYYSVVLDTSNRLMPSKLNEFFSDFDFDSLGDDWHDNHTTLRDYEGDYEGIEIYYDESIESVFDYIANKLNIDTSIIGKNSIKITNI